jgi:hypothetical protein
VLLNWLKVCFLFKGKINWLDHQLVLDICHILSIPPSTRKESLISAIVPLLPSLRTPVGDNVLLRQVCDKLGIQEASEEQLFARVDQLMKRLDLLESGLDDMRGALFEKATASNEQVLERATRICRAWKSKKESRSGSKNVSQHASSEGILKGVLDGMSILEAVSGSESVIDVVGLSPNTQAKEEARGSDSYELKREMLRQALLELENSISSVPTYPSTRSTSRDLVMDEADGSDWERSVALKRLERMLNDSTNSADSFSS